MCRTEGRHVDRAKTDEAVPLTYEQFHYSFANAVGEDEAKELYLGYSVPGAGEPLFQAASANINPWSEAKVDSTNPMAGRGHSLTIDAGWREVAQKALEFVKRFT